MARDAPSLPPFGQMLACSGELYRRAPGRETLKVSIGGRHYVLKRHTGVGWREIFKNLLQGRLPVIGADNERRGLEALRLLGIAAPGVVAFERRGCNPARRRSYLLSECLENTISLEHYGARGGLAPHSLAEKRLLVERLADIARRMHAGGVNHRDFYLCHFHIPHGTPRRPPVSAASPIYLIDLHRAQIRRRTPRRWRAKDLGGLMYSALDNGLTRSDCLRFARAYSGQPLRVALRRERALWGRTLRNAAHLYRKAHGRDHPLIARLRRSGAARR